MQMASLSRPARVVDAPRQPDVEVRTWLLTNAPSPYQAELLTAIARRPELMLSVRLMRSSSNAGRAVESQYGGLPMSAIAPPSWRDELRLHPRAVWEAGFGRFDCFVLSGLYTSITFLSCAVVLAIRGKPWIAWFERPRQASVTSRSRKLAPLAWVRDRVRRYLLQEADRVLCIGSAARSAYSEMGIPLERLDVLPYCCDLERYDAVPSAAIDQFRKRHELAGLTVFLFSGQLIHRKGVDTLIAAFRKLAASHPDCVLLILGDGPLRQGLQGLAGPDCGARIRFLGHLPQEDLPVVFRAADVFVFPSRHDGWGVVINEACAAGLPIIASEQTGAAQDLVQPEENGFRHDAEDVESLCQSMRYLVEHPDHRSVMGRRSHELVRQFSPEAGAERFVQAVRLCLSQYQ
jgi:glycosyltransferase involved in cell wall biosynthesis